MPGLDRQLCGNCAAALRPGTRFCVRCGHRVAAPIPAPAPPAQDFRSPQDYRLAGYQQPQEPPPGYQPAREPAWGYQPPLPPGPPPRRRRRGPVIAGILAGVVLLGGGAAAVLLVHPFGSHETPGKAADTSRTNPAASSGPVSPGPAAPSPVSPAAAAVTERQAASNVAGMLSRSVSDRAAIDRAVSDVSDCGPSLHSDPGVFIRAASSRRALLARLAAMPGRSSLPPALLADLSDAWQASIAADDDFARWANDESTQNCVPGDTSDPGYRAATTPDNEATRYKRAFTALWNPLAVRYGLAQYQWSQL